MDLLLTKLNYTFQNIKLLKQALIHRSYSETNNERLEFLGDGCLNFIVAEALFRRLPDAKEGELSNLRSHLVKEETLAEIALQLGLNHYIILSHGEKKNDGAMRPSTLADTLEAILGAIFLDACFGTVRRVILELYEPYFARIKNQGIKDLNEHFKDPKSRLQEKLQALNKEIPVYEIIEISGKDHEQLFKVACRFEGHISTAEGTSKKRAEQKAARLMLDKLS